MDCASSWGDTRPRKGWEGSSRSRLEGGDVQGDGEELRNTTQHHNHRNHQVDDATKTRYLMLVNNDTRRIRGAYPLGRFCFCLQRRRKAAGNSGKEADEAESAGSSWKTAPLTAGARATGATHKLSEKSILRKCRGSLIGRQSDANEESRVLVVG